MRGKRWAMVIDINKVLEDENFDACMEACHRVHNVPKYDDPKNEIKWIWTDKFEHVFPDQAPKDRELLAERLRDKQIPLLCNHCDDPPCVRVCPTQATFKREDGIVMMDMHRCIGCRFCMAACPYGSRSFNWFDPQDAPKELNPDFPTNKKFPARTRGVVEKCNFCAERLAVGQIPVCVEACTSKALVFGDLNDPQSEVRRLIRENHTIRRKPTLGTEPEVHYII